MMVLCLVEYVLKRGRAAGMTSQRYEAARKPILTLESDRT